MFRKVLNKPADTITVEDRLFTDTVTLQKQHILG